MMLRGGTLPTISWWACMSRPVGTGRQAIDDRMPILLAAYGCGGVGAGAGAALAGRRGWKEIFASSLVESRSSLAEQ